MNYLYEKISYLKGLTDGLAINESTKEGKVLTHIVDVLEELTEAVSEVRADHEELSEYVEFIDEDLSAIEDELYLDCNDCSDCDDEFTEED